MTTTDRYAVFGSPIKHSKSPRIHRLFAEQTGQALSYEAQEVTAEAFPATVKGFFEAGGKGLNCTVPLKELAYRFATHKTERAQRSKAVNTLVLQTDGAILGDNTDGCGLVTDLLHNHRLTLTGKNVLILGAGGASRGIIGPILGQSPTRLVVANRTTDKAVLLAEEFKSIGDISGCGFEELGRLQFDLILNATAASLSGQLPPLPDRLLASQASCYDLAYGNEPTAFVRWGFAHGARLSLDGLGMLVEQAAEAFFIWRGVRPQTRPVIELLDGERKKA
ncbi:shikimate dehydrogenase [Methylomicrobium sp. Wu6]|uniref:shikimate dehydrogenase n=1 Tax=Methylomicrobium sp. Wu6 TaxID=3107928 RepID=UPI002DD6B94A|nr:shikimate dehydrogenase [Methylomicrobium sp. Wu6]MEC4747987.1 shikimate dehydrogenase [Methylomicrobium sp. Wu6]